MIDLKELLDLITEDIVINIMEEYDAPLHHTGVDSRTGQKLLWFKTICHNGDSHKLCYFTDSKDFYCYTSCGRMPFFEFIKRIKNATDKEFYSKVVVYIAQKVGKNFSNNRREFNLNPLVDVDSIRDDFKHFELKQESAEELEYLKSNNWQINNFYEDTILNYFDKNCFYEGWINEGISIPSMEKYGISWYEYQKYIIIPHYDINGNLIGIRRRSLKPEDSNNKYMPLFIEGKDYGHSLGLNLYGAYQNKNRIMKMEEVVIVEGEKSVLQSDSYFGDYSTAVATCGFNISFAQIQLLKSLGVNRIFLGFDKDYDDRFEEIYKTDEDTYKGYLRYKEKIKSLCQRLVVDFNVFLLKDYENLLQIKDSPFDRGKETFLKLKADSFKHPCRCFN